MAKHKRFADRAGYTRHCWECVHAKGWQMGYGYNVIARCEMTDGLVGKYDSPYNPCCHLDCGSYYDGSDDG